MRWGEGAEAPEHLASGATYLTLPTSWAPSLSLRKRPERESRSYPTFRQNPAAFR